MVCIPGRDTGKPKRESGSVPRFPDIGYIGFLAAGQVSELRRARRGHSEGASTPAAMARHPGGHIPCATSPCLHTSTKADILDAISHGAIVAYATSPDTGPQGWVPGCGMQWQGRQAIDVEGDRGYARSI